MLTAGQSKLVIVGSVLGSSAIGPLADSPVAIALLPVAQRIADMPGRVSQLLVEPEPGADAAVTRGLNEIAAGRLFVGPARAELTTARPDRQAQRPVHDAVRRHRRDGRLPARVERDADDGPRSPAVRRRAAHPGLRPAADCVHRGLRGARARHRRLRSPACCSGICSRTRCSIACRRTCVRLPDRDGADDRHVNDRDRVRRRRPRLTARDAAPDARPAPPSPGRRDLRRDRGEPRAASRSGSGRRACCCAAAC